MTGRRVVQTADAPPPAGTYNQAIIGGGLLFISGQTPRLPDGTRIGSATFETQVRRTLDNLQSVASAAGATLSSAFKVTVYLRDPTRAPAFDAIYREYVGDDPPARTLVQSSLPDFALEVDAILPAP